MINCQGLPPGSMKHVTEPLEKSLTEIFPDLRKLVPYGRQGSQKLIFFTTWRHQRALLKLFYRKEPRSGRIQREIEAYSKVQSEYVPRIYESGQVKIGGRTYAYLIEQFIEGSTYREVLDRRRRQPLESVLPVWESLLRACTDFERAGVVHRDIKPDNILLDHQGKVWIVDFGIVRILNLPSITATGLYRGVGTPGYAPPEQFRNIKQAISSRTDLYSVGIVMYEALCGRNPYLDDWPHVVDILRRMEREELPPLTIPGDTPEGDLAGFLQRLIKPDPEERPAGAEQALAEFLAIRARLPLDSEPRG